MSFVVDIYLFSESINQLIFEYYSPYAYHYKYNVLIELTDRIPTFHTEDHIDFKAEHPNRVIEFALPASKTHWPMLRLGKKLACHDRKARWIWFYTRWSIDKKFQEKWQRAKKIEWLRCSRFRPPSSEYRRRPGQVKTWKDGRVVIEA